MKMTEGIMGMSVALEVLDASKGEDLDEILDYFHEIDELFSTYKKTSQISRINRKELRSDDASPEVKKILKLCEETKLMTKGYFDIKMEGYIDPSGLVKGYAIFEASKKLAKKGYKNYYIEIGGDIDIRGLKNGQKWKVGIKNPVKNTEDTKILNLTNCGIATSGSYERGNHIYDPVRKKIPVDIVSLTVIGPNIYEADRFATAAYAMGVKGLGFLERKEDFEAFIVGRDGHEFMTSGFDKYLHN